MFETTLQKFNSIGLDELYQAKLLRRIDTKYLVNKKSLDLLLNKAVPFYRLLKVDDQLFSEYETIYFDTPNQQFYHDHHRKKLSRSKIRKRRYLNSDAIYLEVKHKSNKGITSKNRLSIENFNKALMASEIDFVNQNLKLSLNLSFTLSNQFKRITLVSKALNERVTIDFDLRYNQNEVIGHYGHKLIIVETKKMESIQSSTFENELRHMRVRPFAFSKYCMGMAQFDNGLKQNSFKTKFRSLKKIYQ